MKRANYYITFFFGLWSILLALPGIYYLIKFQQTSLLYPIIITLMISSAGVMMGIWVARIYYYSYKDHLTGVFNRRYLDFVIKKGMPKLVRKRGCLSIAIIDMDYFKTINDKYGHQTGDCILVEFTKLLVNNSRKTDSIIRLGGDEFLVVLPGVNYGDARNYAERIRSCICQLADFGELSICMDVATTIREMDCKTLIREADRALYQAKTTRNSVVCTMV